MRRGIGYVYYLILLTFMASIIVLGILLLPTSDTVQVQNVTNMIDLTREELNLISSNYALATYICYNKNNPVVENDTVTSYSSSLAFQTSYRNYLSWIGIPNKSSTSITAQGYAYEYRDDPGKLVAESNLVKIYLSYIYPYKVVTMSGYNNWALEESHKYVKTIIIPRYSIQPLANVSMGITDQELVLNLSVESRIYGVSSNVFWGVTDTKYEDLLDLGVPFVNYTLSLSSINAFIANDYTVEDSYTPVPIIIEPWSKDGDIYYKITVPLVLDITRPQYYVILKALTETGLKIELVFKIEIG